MTEELDDVESVDKKIGYQCPHGSWACPYEQLEGTFKAHGKAFAGDAKICTMCVEWAKVRQLMELKEAIKEPTLKFSLVQEQIETLGKLVEDVSGKTLEKHLKKYHKGK